jgi:hypothetical protein
MSIIPATWEAKIRRIEIQGQPRQNNPIFKITRAKWIEGVAQEVEW